MSGQDTVILPGRRPQRTRRGRRARAIALPTVVAAATAGLVVAAVTTDPQPDPAGALPAALTLPVQERRAVLVCPGPENAVVPPGSRAEKDKAATAVSSVATGTTSAAGPTPLQLDVVDLNDAAGLQAAAAQAGAAPSAGGTAFSVAARSTLTGPSAVLAAPAGTGPVPGRVLSAATQITRWSPPGDDPGDPATTRGLSARACQPAVSRTWLVGGATTAGHATRLLLSNPTTSAALVDVRLLGPAGALTPDGGKQITVRAGASVALFLESLAPALPSVVVEVTTRSGRVTATLHDVIVRGVTAGGTDDIGAAASPRQVQVVPGVVVSTEADRAQPDPDNSGTGDSGDTDDSTSGGGTDPADTGDDDLDLPPLTGSPGPTTAQSPGATVIRVGVPGTRPAAVQVGLIGPDGPLRLPGGVASIPAGAVRDLVVGDVPDGVYAAVVQANVPVVAGAVSGRTRAGGQWAGTKQGYGHDVPASEFAWTAGGTEIPAGGTTLAVPDVAQARLNLVAPQGAAKVSYRVVDAEGNLGPQTMLSLKARHASTLDLPTGSAGVVLAATGRAYAALILTDSDADGPLQSVVALVSQPGGGVAARQARQEARLGGGD